MDSNFDVDNISIESLMTAVNYLIYIYNFYVYLEDIFKYDMHMLVTKIETILNPYTLLYNNEEYNPFDSLSSVSKYIFGKNLSSDSNLSVYEFCIKMIDVVLMKTNFVLANKINNNAINMTDDYLNELLNFLKESEYDNKSASEWVEHFNTKVKALESELKMKTKDITANETSPEYDYMSYLSSFLPFMTRTNEKKGGIATRKKKYRRRYKKQIKRRTKKTRSTH
jgi:hypothetical protein